MDSEDRSFSGQDHLTFAGSLAPFDVSVSRTSAKQSLYWSLMSWNFLCHARQHPHIVFGGGPPLQGGSARRTGSGRIVHLPTLSLSQRMSAVSVYGFSLRIQITQYKGQGGRITIEENEHRKGLCLMYGALSLFVY